MSGCTCLAQRLEALEQGLSEDENNYGRALALLEDRIKQLEARASQADDLINDHEERLNKIERQELNEVDERLCRLESPGVWEIDRRATAEPSKTSKEGAAPTRVFECRHCSEANPCILRVDAAAANPEFCAYGGSVANWCEVLPAAKKPKTCAVIIGS